MQAVALMLTLTAIRSYCQKKPGTVVEDFPFDEDTLAIKIFGKAFLFSSLSAQPPSINLKCRPDKALELRARYDAVRPGYHMNKKHWNTVILDGSIPPNEILAWIDHSYDEVVKGLRKAERETIAKWANRRRKESA